jgi:hypothetical protein
MKIFKILLLLSIVLPIEPLVQFAPQAHAVLQRAITGYGDTKGEAYANATAKIPSGYTQTRVSFFKVGYKWQCYLICQK